MSDDHDATRAYYETHSTEAEITQAVPNERRASSMVGYTIALPIKALAHVRRRADQAGVTTGEMLAALILVNLGNIGDIKDDKDDKDDN